MYRQFSVGPAFAAVWMSLLALASSAHAEAGAGPFAGMAGSWSGGGSFTTSYGSREALRCRSNNSVGSGGNSLTTNLRCASASTNLALSSSVHHRGGALSGSWSEATRGVSGRIAGRVQGNRISARASSDMFTASLALTTKGNRQSIFIRPHSRDFGVVSVSLSKR
jgi:hypothetical protein